jgi:hypothetical protein
VEEQEVRIVTARERQRLREDVSIPIINRNRT